MPWGYQEQGVQHHARAEPRIGSGCWRAGKGGPAPSRETSLEGAGEIKHCGMALPETLKCCECCRGVYDLQQQI